jgi:hypothetical protein
MLGSNLSGISLACTKLQDKGLSNWQSFFPANFGSDMPLKNPSDVLIDL